MLQKSDGFRRAFSKRVRRSSGGRSIRVPDFPLEDIEDNFAFYVLIIGISEDVFWNADISLSSLLLKIKERMNRGLRVNKIYF